MRNIWIITLLAVSTWSQETGHNTTSRSQSPTPEPRVTVSRSEHFHLGSNVTLWCSNKTWNEMIYTIWKINLAHKSCQISSTGDGPDLDTCKDGKLLGNSSGVPFLYIPMFSREDEGVYYCETPYSGGAYAANINVSAVCLEGEGSRWRLDCPEIPIGPFQGPYPLVIIISIVTVSVVIVVLGGIYTLRNLSTLRNCFGSNTTPAESKCPPVEEVEEVEPYASYVQRDNSIYKSHADLLT